MRRSARRRLLIVLAALGLFAATACSAASGSASASAPTVSAGQQLYISLGDSYAAGYQPDGHGGGGTSEVGFPYLVTSQAQRSGIPLVLANFGCAGVTTTQIVGENGCLESAAAPGGDRYPDTSQAAAALALMKENAGSTRLVTLVMGGNDLQPCLTEARPQACVEQRLPVLRRNLDGLLTAIRAAVGDQVPIVGLTYPDVYLGLYLKKDPQSEQTVQRSLELFRTYLNPTLAEVYGAHGAKFVDITAMTGAYTSADDTQTLAPYGTVPVAVARVCQLTWFCKVGDVHPNPEGHALIAAAVLKAAQS